MYRITCILSLFALLGNCQNSQNVTPTNFDYYLEDQFCFPNTKIPFYQRDTDGAVCCGGKELPVITLPPEVKGECAISTKTGADGSLDSKDLVQKLFTYHAVFNFISVLLNFVYSGVHIHVP